MQTILSEMDPGEMDDVELLISRTRVRLEIVQIVVTSYRK